MHTRTILSLALVVAGASAPAAIAQNRPTAPAEVMRAPAGRPPPIIKPGKPLVGRAAAPWLDRAVVNPNLKFDPKRVQDILYARRLGDRFTARLCGKSMGMAIVAILPSGVSVERSCGQARSKPDTAPRAMTVDDKFSVASVSKVFTGVTIARLIADRAAKGESISLDSKIKPFLPPAWSYSASFEPTTFRSLLLHKAGVRCDTEVVYLSLKGCVAKTINPADIPNQSYNNNNYGLLRLATSRLGGMPAATDAFLTSQEQSGNTAVPAASDASLFLSHVNKIVFSPAGLPFVFCKQTDAAPGLSYKSVTDPNNMFDFSNVLPGDPWGDMTLSCGSRGLNLSARQLAKTMHTLFHSEKILNAAVRQDLVANGPPFWPADHGAGLTSVSHGGYHPAEMNKGEINTMVVQFSNGISVGMIVNSRFNGNMLGEVAASIQEASVN